MKNRSRFALRRLVAAVATALSLVPMAAGAAGLGKITLLSGLGQPLRAEVDVSALRDEVAGMSVRLAPADAFTQAGVELGAALSDLQFSLAARSNGQPVIRISSDKPVTEPYLNFLLELNWASGRLVREYNFLLDVPPDAGKRSAPATVDNAHAGSKEAAADKQAKSADAVVVKKGQTLRQIALDHMQDGVTLEQMLVALYRANGEAFMGQNLNRLKAGAVLNMPDPASAAAIPAAEAKKVFHAQVADWQAYRQKLATAATQAPARQEAAGQSDAGKVGKLEARVEEKAAAQDANRDQVKVSRTRNEKPGGPSEEDLIAKDRALKEAQERLAILEKNVAELQRLVDLKNKSLADLQQQMTAQQAAQQAAQLAAQQAAAKQAAEAKAAAAAKPEAKTEAKPETKPEVKPAESSDKPVAKEAAEPAKAEGGDKPANEAAKPEEETKPVEAEAAKPEENDKAAAEDKSHEDEAEDETSEDEPEPSLMETWGLPLMGGGLALGLLGGGLIYRRRRAKAQADAPLASPSDEATPTRPVDEVAAPEAPAALARQEEEEKPAETDPIAEADVYLGYGRPEHAEEILVDALHKSPDDLNIQLKLLEVYAAQKDVGRFEELTAKLYVQTGGAGDEWEKVAELGRRVDQHNRKQAASAAPETDIAAELAALMPQEAEATEEAPLASEPQSIVPAEPEEPVDTSSVLDFDLGALGAAPVRPAAVAEPVPEEAELDRSAEIALAEQMLAEAMQAEASASPLDNSAMDVPNDDVLDFDLGMLDQSPARAVAAVDTPPADEPTEVAALEADEAVGEPPAATEPESDLAAEWDRLTAEIESEPESEAAQPELSVGELAALMAAEAEVPVTTESAEPEALPADVADAIDAADTQTAWSEAAEQDAGEAAAETADLPQPTFDMSSINLDLSSIDAELPAEDDGLGGLDLPEPKMTAPTEVGAEDMMDVASDASRAAPALPDPLWEETNTKLDLAKAYEEMGDMEGAKELLAEVLVEGSPDLVEKAQAALDRIG